MQTGADTPVGAAMTIQFDSAEPSEMLEGAVRRREKAQAIALPDVDAEGSHLTVPHHHRVAIIQVSIAHGRVLCG